MLVLALPFALKKRAANGPGMAPEFGDGFVSREDRHIIDARPAMRTTSRRDPV